MIHTVGVADMKISNRAEDVLITYALGSCLGIIIFDPVAGVGGLLHCMLPSGKASPEAARENPCKFVDTGVPALFRAAYALGARKERIVLKVCGGASTLDEKGHFRIGERNYAMLRRLLWKNGVAIQAEQVGGSTSRTVYLEMETGRVIVKADGHSIEL